VLVLHADGEGLRIRTHLPEVAVEYHEPGPRPPATLPLPVEALADCEGRNETAVRVEGVGADAVRVRWDDAGLPQVRDYQAADLDKLPPFPDGPARFAPLAGGCLKALDAVAQCVAREGVRFALQRLQLRGGKGEVIATDGRQLLVQGGFNFPWKEDVLVPAVGVFACRELPPEGPVSVGKTDTHVGIRSGSWTFHLAIDTAGRFPAVDQVIPVRGGGGTTCKLSPEDAALLLRALPRLPGRGEGDEPVTVDLNGRPVIRTRGEGHHQAVEVVLKDSAVTGPAVRFVSNRRHLAHALQLGFGTLQVAGPERPVVCRDGTRTYLWVPLDPKGAVPPQPEALQVRTAARQPAGVKPRPVRARRGRPEPTGVPSADGPGAMTPAESAVERPRSPWAWLKRLAGLAALVRDQRRREQQDGP
jgi:hypothetical protein